MSDILVDPGELEQLARELARLKAEFEGLGNLMEDYEKAAGHKQVARKLEDFADNWSDEKPKVTEQLEKLAGMAAGAACFYREREAGLAAQIGEASGNLGSG